MPVYGQNQIALNECWDLDAGIEVGCGVSTADFQCTTVNAGGGATPAEITAVQNARAWFPNGTSRNLINASDVIGFQWTTIDAVELFTFGSGETSFNVFVTTNATWYKFHSNTASDGFCEFFNGTASTISGTPFFTGGYTTSDTGTLQINDTTALYIDFNDLGYIVDLDNTQSAAAGMTMKYLPFNNILTVLNGTRVISPLTVCPVSNACIQDGTATTPGSRENLELIVNCNAQRGQNTTIDFLILNTPFGGFDEVFTYLCFFPDFPGQSNLAGAMVLNLSTTVLGDPGSVRRDVRIHTAYYDMSVFDLLTNVQNDPVNPQPGQNVLITFDTTLKSNTSVFWRSRDATNLTGEFTAFASLFNDTEDDDHNITIPGEFIIDNRFYQYFVIGGSIVDNNTDAFYNFTVGAVGVFVGNQTAPLVPITGRISDQLGIGFSDFIYVLGIILLMIPTTFAWRIGGEKIGIGVFTTLFIAEITIGLLPFFLFIPVALILTLALTSILMKKFGGGG